VYLALKADAKFLVVEPKGHVSESNFETTISIAEIQDLLSWKIPKFSEAEPFCCKKRGKS
jgi:hypothetical protein